MFKAITNLFASTTTKPTTRKASLGFESMETRDAPAVLYTAATIRSFDPQPEPPLNTIVQVGTVRGIVISGG